MLLLSASIYSFYSELLFGASIEVACDLLLSLYLGALKALSTRYQGAINAEVTCEALLRLNYGSITALLRLY